VPTSNAASAATLHRRIAEYICRLRFDDLPDEVVEQAKEMLVYHLGLAFSGYFTEIGAQARAVARELGRGSGDATVIGERFRAPPVDAVIANASLMRELRLDDVLFPAGVHPGLVILPVALALGEQQRCTGQDLLTAIVVGYDVIGTLGGLAWAWSAPLPRRPTIPYGAFGPTAAAARLLGLDAEQTSRAVGYAAHFAMGIPEGDLPSHYYGLVARNGIMAATLARLGGVVAPTVLEGRFGFFNSFLGAVPAGVEDALAGLGRRFQIMGTTTKRYPGTALNIVPIQLALDMVATDGCTAENVAAIRVFLSDLRRNFSDGHSKGPFASRLYASSSLPFGLALSLLDGRLDDDRYDQFDSRRFGPSSTR
jgi:2-methylcitrate dehydratase PrpD